MTHANANLPQLSGDIFICDGGVETDIIFNHATDIPHFAAHVLLYSEEGRTLLANYFRDYLRLAGELNVGYILDTVSWKAHPIWAEELGVSESELRQINHDCVDFISSLREEFLSNSQPILLNGFVGPMGDAYEAGGLISHKQATDYHAQQLGWLSQTNVDMVSAMTFAQSMDAAGVVSAANKVGLPIVISFTVETDGNLPSGQPLSEAITEVDETTECGAAYFMINCAHPDHFSHVLEDDDWSRRIRGIRCNASRKSHEELDNSETLDDGDPAELASQYLQIKKVLPWVNIFGACCGSDIRHVTSIANAVLHD